MNASVDAANTINFSIGTGPQTIAPPTAFPDIVKTVTIDGFSQPGSSLGAPLIRLDGGEGSGLTLSGVNGCLIEGLEITRFNSGSLVAGIKIIGGSNNRVQGNFIGGSDLNNRNGVIIQGGSTDNIIGTDGDSINDAAEGNIISGNITGDGVEIEGIGTTGNRVAGNLIGVSRTGNLPLSNENGVVITGGASDNIIGTNGDGVSDDLERNIISGNLADGVLINGGSDNRVSGNFIGTGVSGMASLGNARLGVLIAQGNGNIIGTTGDGTSDTLEGNVISGNNGHGIVIDGDSNHVSGNQIGTNVTGTAAIPNFGDGVLLRISASHNIIDGNLISGNGFSGVEIKGGETSRNLVAGNRIGTDAAGTAAIPNVNDGVFIHSGAFGNTVGGTTPGTGNVIAFNSKGVVVGSNLADVATVGNSILGNSIFANTSLGIDLANNGVTPNHPQNPEAGPNHLQNFPIITAATSTTVSGTFNSTPGRTFVLEFFASAEPSGQGQTFLGTTTIATNALGDATFTATLGSAIPPNQFVTATATDTTTGDTSEFSAGFNASADLSVTKVAAPAQLFVGEDLTYTILVTNNGPNIATGVIVTDMLPAGAAFVTAGTTQGTVSEAVGVVTATLGELGSGATATVTIIVRPTATGTLSNIASVAGQQPDPNLANNTTQPVVTLVGPAPVESTDLAAAKSVDSSSAMVGQSLTYRLTASNLGPHPDPAVVLADLLPAGVTFVSSSIPPTTQTAGSLSFNLGSMAVGASVTVTVVVIPNVPGTIINQAIVESSIPDHNPSNDVAMAQTVVTAIPPVTVVTLQRFGFHRQPTLLVLTFSAALDPATAQDVSNYRLERLGHNQRPVRTYRIASATYDTEARTVTLRFHKLLPLFARYRLTVNGSTPGGVTDASGRLIDGAGTGQPGSDYVRTFGRNILAGPNPFRG